jgi:hypothetical protein
MLLKAAALAPLLPVVMGIQRVARTQSSMEALNQAISTDAVAVGGRGNVASANLAVFRRFQERG